MKLAISVLMSALLLLLSACMSDADDPAPTATIAPAAVTATQSPASTATPAPAAEATATSEPSPTTAAPTATTAPAATATTPGATGTPEDAVTDIEVALAQVAAIVADIRGLEWSADVPVSIVSRAELQAYMLASMESEYSAEEARQDTQLLWLLRLLDDPTLDIYQLYADVIAESVAGLYDPDNGEVLTLGEGDGLTPLAAMIMAHEYTHALQDQYFGLNDLRSDELNAEEQFAVLALIEGDAEVVRTLYLINHMSPGDLRSILSDPALESDIPEDMPAYLLEVNYFPYTSGAEFATYLYQRGGFAAIDEAYADPPRSTEQILHPEKYYGPERDEPVVVEIPDLTSALGEGWSEIQNEVVGEFDLRIMLRENGVSNWESAAAGWGGGRYLFYVNGESGVLVNRVAWDSDEDREEFDGAFIASLSGMQDTGGIYDDGMGRFHAIVQYEGTTVFVASNDRDALQRVLAQFAG